MPRKKGVPPAPPIPATPLPEHLWSVEEVQKFLGVCRKRVFQLMHESGLPYIQWDRTIRFHPHEVSQWAVSQQQRSA